MYFMKSKLKITQFDEETKDQIKYLFRKKKKSIKIFTREI